MWVPQSEILEWDTEPRIGKSRVRPCPKGEVTVSEQILSLANPAHSGRSTHRTRGTKWRYQARKSKMTAPHKENNATVASLAPNETRSAVSWLASEINRALGQNVFGGDLSRSESQHCTCNHDLESELTCEWKSRVLCQASSWEVKLTCEWKSPVH